MNFAHADAVKPDSRPGAGKFRMLDLAMPFRPECSRRFFFDPGLPAKPGSKANPGGEINQIEQIWRHARSPFPLAEGNRIAFRSPCKAEFAPGGIPCPSCLG